MKKILKNVELFKPKKEKRKRNENDQKLFVNICENLKKETNIYCVHKKKEKWYTEN